MKQTDLVCVLAGALFGGSGIAAGQVAELPQSQLDVNFPYRAPELTAGTGDVELLPHEVKVTQEEASADVAAAAGDSATEGEAEAKEEDEPVDPTLRPLQYFKDELVRSCMGLHWMKDVEVSGYLDQTYTYNFNRPGDRINSLRVYDRKHNSYMLNMFQLYAVKDPTEESRWGFATRLAMGYDADINSSFNEHNTDKIDFEELYGSYLFDIGENGLLVKAGKMVTLAGAEVIEQKDNWNISRSFLYGYAIPLTHTGLRANYKINVVYDLTVGVNRGWDAFRYDNNDEVSYEARLGAAVNDRLTLGATVIAGPEQEGNDRNNRRLLDLVATYKFSDKLTGMLNYDIADEEKAANNGGKARWQGLAAYLKYDCNEKLSYVWRGEVFEDDGGARTGDSQTLIGNTLTAQYKFRENLIGRVEYRHDRSSESSFSRGSGFGSNQNTVAASVMITF
jgi:hypothetical protein